MSNKFNARATTVDGVRFASIKEASRYQELRLLLTAGQIGDLQTHPAWSLVVNGVVIGRYTADFAYTDRATGAPVVEDVKSPPTRTEVYRLRKKLMRALYEIEIVEV